MYQIKPGTAFWNMAGNGVLDTGRKPHHMTFLCQNFDPDREMVWVSMSAIQEIYPTVLGTPSVTVPPAIPLAVCVLGGAPVLSSVMIDDECDYLVALDHLTWDVHPDSTVSVVGHTERVRRDGITRALPERVGDQSEFIDIAIDPDTGSLLSYRDACDLIGKPIPESDKAPPRFLQRRLAAVASGIWQLWHEPRELVEHRRVPGTPSKARRRHGKRRQPSPIRIIDVRPHEGGSHGGHHHAGHDYRWLVRGHWRMQPCGKGHADRKRIWIEEHSAGPGDKPLRTTPRVNVIR
jgi:hypothetical protein